MTQAPLERPSAASKTSYRTTLSSSPSLLDYVIEFESRKDPARAAKQLADLITALSNIGLLTQVRPAATKGDVLVFVKCPRGRLIKEVYEARCRDWVNGIRVAAPELNDATETIKDSERLRLVFLMMTSPKHEHGAGITPGFGEWDHVASIFPLHNRDFDRAWLRRWSTKWLVDDVELEHLCEHFGTKIAMYFAFLQYYLLGLAVPAALGLFSFFFLPEYSILFSVGIMIWGILFIALWERKQNQLASRWDVKDCTKMEQKRADFVGNPKEMVSSETDSVPTFSSLTRLFREMLVIPFAFVSAAFLAAVLTSIFAIEVFIGEVYDGPLKSVLTFTPTILFTLVVSPFSSKYLQAAKILTLFENHETDAGYNAAYTRKTFLLNFMTSYTALFLTLYVYLPFGHLIVPKLDIFGLTTAYSAYGVAAKPFELDSHRLRNQLFYFTVTAQAVNLVVEFALPIVLRLIKGEAKELQAKFSKNDKYKPDDAEEEAQFLTTVREEAALPEYDQYGDYAEMVIQFGYSVMFSPIWPLTPLCAFINNIIEVRADAAKLCKNMRRPVPMRADSIGPWADHLSFLSWLGSLTTGSIVYLLRGDSPTTKPFIHMLAICLFSEHAFLLLRKCINIALSRIISSGELESQRLEHESRRSRLAQLTKDYSLPSETYTEQGAFFTDSVSTTVSKALVMLKNPNNASTGSQKKEL